MINVEAYALAKKYTDKAIEGAGAILGAPCQVKSIEDIPGGHRITLCWKLNDGTEQEDYFDVMDSVSPTISDDPDNALEQHEDGWYVPDIQGVEISQEEGNILTQEDDGLYVSAVQSVTAGSDEGTLDVDGTEITLFTLATTEEIDALFA